MSLPLCEHCTSGHHLPGDPRGTIQPDGSYFHPAPTGEDSSSNTRAIVLLTDAFGLSLKNSKILADGFSERLGCDVWVPDIFEGDPIIREDKMIEHPQTPGKTTTWTTLRMIFFFLFNALPQFIRNRTSVVDPRIDTFIRKIKTNKGYSKIGVIGYCFGGSASIRLGSRGLVDSIIVCHPGRCTLEEIKLMKIPTAWVMAEEDFTFGPKIRAEAEAVFAARKGGPNFVDYEFKDYKGTVHGFAARPDFGMPEVKTAFEGAFEQAVGWFSKTLA